MIIECIMQRVIGPQAPPKSVVASCKRFSLSPNLNTLIFCTINESFEYTFSEKNIYVIKIIIIKPIIIKGRNSVCFFSIRRYKTANRANTNSPTKPNILSTKTVARASALRFFIEYITLITSPPIVVGRRLLENKAMK